VGDPGQAAVADVALSQQGSRLGPDWWQGKRRWRRNHWPLPGMPFDV